MTNVRQRQNIFVPVMIRYSAHLKTPKRTRAVYLCSANKFFFLSHVSLYNSTYMYRIQRTTAFMYIGYMAIGICIYSKTLAIRISFRLLASQIKWRVSLELFFSLMSHILRIYGDDEYWAGYICIFVPHFNLSLVYNEKIWPLLRSLFIRMRKEEKKTCILQFIYS